MIDVLVVLLVLLPPFDIAAAVILTVISRRHPSHLTLRERAFTAIIAAIVAGIAWYLAFVRYGVFNISGELALTLIALGLVLVSVPSLYWLLLLATGRFRIPGNG